MQQIKELLPDIQNKVQVQQDLTPSNVSDVDFEIAIANEKIVNTSVPKLKEVLRLVMLKIGLRAANIPQDEEKFVLVQHIIQHYGGHTPEEILLAFDMAIAGKLEVEVNCYENFSCLYFSGIMNAYRLWAKDQHKQIKPIQMLEPPKEDLSDQSMEDWIKTLKNETRVDFMPVMVYEWLEKKGKINYTNREKWLSVQRAIKFTMGRPDYSPEMTDKTAMNILAKKFLLLDYITQMK